MMDAAISPGGLLAAALTTLGILIAAGGLYLLTLAGAAFFYREAPASSDSTHHLVVLIPAHNEAEFIQRCVASLMNQDYPTEKTELVVIADNCTDRTAQLASAAGATVLVRDAPVEHGKGHALSWAIEQITRRCEHPPDAFVIVDGDSVADQGLLSGLAQYLDRGADAVQAEYLVLVDNDSAAVQLRAVAFLLFHRVRFAGRSVLRLPCALVGNGMLLSRRLMERYPWNAFTGAEDLEFSVALRRNAIAPVFAGGARLYGPVPDSRRSAQLQRERWEGGRLRVTIAVLPQLLREIFIQRRGSLVDLAVDLVVPPVGLLTAGAVAGAVFVGALSSMGLVSLLVLVPWLSGLFAVLAFVLVGLRSAHAPPWMYRRLLSTPGFLMRKLLGTVGVIRSRSSDTWIRTERPNEVVS
jgi:cellulose synthase/poly-beta-1,6-N-acetylglucosamine synthase-like glycosyltransferase